MKWNFRQRESSELFFSLSKVDFFVFFCDNDGFAFTISMTVLRFLALLCRTHIYLERVAFRCGDTFITILRQAETDSLHAQLTNAASQNGLRKKPPLKAQKVR